jgi:hypothetical protein
MPVGGCRHAEGVDDGFISCIDGLEQRIRRAMLMRISRARARLDGCGRRSSGIKFPEAAGQSRLAPGQKTPTLLRPHAYR